MHQNVINLESVESSGFPPAQTAALGGAPSTAHQGVEPPAVAVAVAAAVVEYWVDLGGIALEFAEAAMESRKMLVQGQTVAAWKFAAD